MASSGGGIGVTQNRTLWPVTGGTVAFQPGWFQGHATAFIYVNLGFGTDGPYGGPQNMSNPMVPPFQILGPNKNPYPGTVCLPQVPLPAGANVKIGDNATIQIVELAVHGAALFSVSLFGPDLTNRLDRRFANLALVRRHNVCRSPRPATRRGQRVQLL